jgi:hydroxymethylpyrimidine kinase/phosphomethylpyrimidine kinase
MRLVPCALAISGLDPSGGAGLFADLRAFRAASVWGCGVAAVVTVQSTMGLRSSEPMPIAQILAQVRELWSHENVRAVKIGALGSLENVRGIARWIASLSGKVPVVVDPVLRASRGRRGARLLEDAAVCALLRLAELGAVITPNALEAEALLGKRVRSLADAERAACALVDLGARAAIVKGGHLANGASREITDVLAIGDRVIHLRAARAKVAPHGTGCMLASLIAGKLAGAPHVDDAVVLASIRWAKRRIGLAIARATRIGAGQLVLP